MLRERKIDEQEATIEALRKDLTGAAAERAFDAGEIARLVAVVTQLRKDLADLNETCDRIARAGMREIDAQQLGY